jgi:hypothetical protein
MSNVLSDEKKQQVIALGKLGSSLRRIEQATGVRRETASIYLKTAGVKVCLPGWGRRAPAKPAIAPNLNLRPMGAAWFRFPRSAVYIIATSAWPPNLLL